MKWEGGGNSVTLWPSIESITYWKRGLPGESGVEGAAWMEISKYVLGACSEHNSRCFPITWRPEKTGNECDSGRHMGTAGLWGALLSGRPQPSELWQRPGQNCHRGHRMLLGVCFLLFCQWCWQSWLFVLPVSCRIKALPRKQEEFFKNYTKLGTFLAAVWLGLPTAPAAVIGSIPG